MVQARTTVDAGANEAALRQGIVLSVVRVLIVGGRGRGPIDSLRVNSRRTCRDAVPGNRVGNADDRMVFERSSTVRPTTRKGESIGTAAEG
jgi:hypothetical protein